MPREVLAVRYGSRVTRKSQSFLNYHVYEEPDGTLEVDYYFWVIRDSSASSNDSAGTNGIIGSSDSPGSSASGDVILIDTGFSPEAGRRRKRDGHFTPADVLPSLGIGPESVRTVVVTHAHWDHTGNLSQFPGAQIVLSQAEYDFWTSPVASRTHFALHSEADEIALLTEARQQGRLTLTRGESTTLAPGIELIQVGGHTPGELIVTVDDGRGTVILASDALHHYEEVDQDRPYAILSDLPAMYQAYDLLAELAAAPGARLVAGHDPQVRTRFAAHPAHLAVTDLGTPRE